MSVIEVIRARRSYHKQMKPEKPAKEIIERMLEAATYAPNHRSLEPWQFFVVAGESRRVLGQFMEETLRKKMPETESEKATAVLAKELNKPLRAPVIIVVVSLESKNAKVPDIENVEGVSAAIQNMLLVAQEEKLVTIWRTGDTVYDSDIKAYFGLQPHEYIVGMIYVGYPTEPSPERIPTHYKEKTIWQGWEEN